LGHGQFDGLDGRFAADEQGNDGAREHDDFPQAHQRHPVFVRALQGKIIQSGH